MSVRVELRRDAGRFGPSSGPWVRRRQIARIYGNPDPHGVAEVADRKGNTLGWGLISAVSNITVRVLSFGPEPPPDDWLTLRLDASVQARRAYGFDRQGTTGYREVNSEGDGLPGLVVDRYEDDLVIQLTTAPMVARQDAIVAWLRERTEGRIHVVRPEHAAAREGFDPEHPTERDGGVLAFSEHGVRFEVPAPPAQKTGAYFDQRDNRQIVARLARRHGGRLLDLGCHVGGFALHARRLGVEAVGVDRSDAALHYAAHNAELNGFADLTWVKADLFGGFEHPALQGRFGTIVVDPPKIASKKGDVDRAYGAMERMSRRAAALLDPGGGHLVLCSCSHHFGREQLDRVALALGPQQFVRVHVLGAAFDHPVAPCHREGEYLRVNVYQPRGAPSAAGA